MIPTESCSGVSTWKVSPNSSGECRSATGIQTEVMNRERSPYAISSSIFLAGVPCVWALARPAPPAARPASAAPPLRNLLRFDFFASMCPLLEKNFPRNQPRGVPMVASIHRNAGSFAPRLTRVEDISNLISAKVTFGRMPGVEYTIVLFHPPHVTRRRRDAAWMLWLGPEPGSHQPGLWRRRQLRRHL